MTVSMTRAPSPTQTTRLLKSAFEPIASQPILALTWTPLDSDLWSFGGAQPRQTSKLLKSASSVVQGSAKMGCHRTDMGGLTLTIVSFVLSNVLDSWNPWFPNFDEKTYARKQVSFQLMCTSRLGWSVWYVPPPRLCRCLRQRPPWLPRLRRCLRQRPPRLRFAHMKQ